MKTCSKCGETKPRAEFNKKSSNKDGLYSQCKICHRAASRKDYEQNRESRLASMRNWQSENREAYLESMRRWREANPEKYEEGIRLWNEANPERKQQHNSAWYKRNRDYAKARARQWAKDNPERTAVRNARRRARMAAQTIPLTQEDEAEIKALYELASHLSQVLGTNFHVDHIKPLKGKNSSGLHVPWNLQILPAEVNLSKSNKEDW